MLITNNLLPSNKDNMNLILVADKGYQLWLGSYSAATNLRLLNDRKIKHVLTVAALIDVQYPPEMSINHKIVNAYDSPSYKISQHFEQAYNFISQALESGNILVHCAAGISRSATCVMVYLMRAKGFRFKEALIFTKSKRPVANPNYGFQNQLGKFDILIRQKKKQQGNNISQNLRKNYTKVRQTVKNNNRHMFPSLNLKHHASYSKNKMLTPCKKKQQQGSLIELSEKKYSISTLLPNRYTPSKLDKLRI